MENLYATMKSYGITTKEMCNAISKLPKIPFSGMDIALIKGNPSLSLFQTIHKFSVYLLTLINLMI